MSIPTSRDELILTVCSTFEKLQVELDSADARAGSFPCVDDWSIKDLLVVRAWWTENVIDWIEAGKRGQNPTTPAAGYRWKETPRLNADVVRKCRRESYRSVRHRLKLGFERVMPTIDSLKNDELLVAGIYEWAGRYPISRWISINTARQYVTARTLIRRAVREHQTHL